MDDALSVFLYRQHERFRRMQPWREHERERWATRQWEFCRELADVEWELNPQGLYVYGVNRAAWQVGYLQGKRRLEKREAATRLVQRVLADDGRPTDAADTP